MNKRDSIYVQLLRLLVLSAAVSAVAFFFLEWGVERGIDRYISGSGYEEKQDLKYIRSLQNYVDENQIASKDSDELTDWVSWQRIITIHIYKDKILVYNSDYPDEKVWKEEISISRAGWEHYYTVTFSDGDALVWIQGLYAYQYYTFAMFAELFLCFGLFLLLVLSGVRKKMKDIQTLSREIKILEGGSLDYQITVKGKDEIAALAAGLDLMRKSFRSMVQQESEIVQENQKVITQMSHDIRTPVTSILLYTEILRQGKYQNEEQLREYLERIERKTKRMKQLTDHLFEYSLVAGETKIRLEEPACCKTVFYDLFSETCSYLEQSGFRASFVGIWKQTKICVCTDYISRIMDNITSNIIKYAAPDSPVFIRPAETEGFSGFAFCNKIRQPDESVESTHVGIHSIRNMMEKMGGKCKVSVKDNEFEIDILFPEACGEGPANSGPEAKG